MLVLRLRLRLVGEALRVLHRGFRIERALQDGLDRDLAVQPAVVAFVDDAHRALAEDALDIVAPDALGFLGLGHPRRLPQAAARSARRRSCSCRWRLRRRIDFGVISTRSSSVMNSTAYSSVRPIGGTRSIASSLPEARILVSCLVRIGFTTRSLSRLWIPTIIPSYTGSPGLTNMRPRSCSFHSAEATATPSSCHTSTPLAVSLSAPVAG